MSLIQDHLLGRILCPVWTLVMTIETLNDFSHSEYINYTLCMDASCDACAANKYYDQYIGYLTLFNIKEEEDSDG